MRTKARGRAQLAVLAVLLGVLTLSTGLHAQSGSEEDASRELTLDRIAKALDLSEEQQAEWKAINQKHAATTKPIVDEMEALSKQIRDARGKDADKETIDSLLEQRKALSQKLSAEREVQDDALAGLLSGDQKQRWDRLKKADRDKDRGRDRGRNRRGRTRG